MCGEETNADAPDAHVPGPPTECKRNNKFEVPIFELLEM